MEFQLLKVTRYYNFYSQYVKELIRSPWGEGVADVPDLNRSIRQSYETRITSMFERTFVYFF